MSRIDPKNDETMNEIAASPTIEPRWNQISVDWLAFGRRKQTRDRVDAHSGRQCLTQLTGYLIDRRNVSR